MFRAAFVQMSLHINAARTFRERQSQAERDTEGEMEEGEDKGEAKIREREVWTCDKEGTKERFLSGKERSREAG